MSGVGTESAAQRHRIERIENAYFKLEILPELGASVLNLRSAAGLPVMREVDPAQVQTSSQCASFTLLPYSNRIRDARFSFNGQEVVLRPTTKDGLVQHGDVRNRPWQVQRRGPAHLSCTFDSRDFPDMNWPWAFTARVDYLLNGPHCDISVVLANADGRDMPAGLGQHPYFTREQDGVDPLLAFQAPLTYDTDERQLPLTSARPVRPDEDFTTPSRVGERRIDRAYAAWDGIASFDWGHRRLTITADNVYSHLIVYTAPDGSLAIEPVSHATDAFNLAAQGLMGTDMRVLAPGEQLAGTVRLTLEGDWS